MDYVPLTKVRRKYFVAITGLGFQPAFENGWGRWGYFYTLHPDTVFSDWYASEEEAQEVLNLRIFEESQRTDLQFEGKAQEQIEKLRKHNGAI